MKKSVILLLICITALSIRCISQTATIVEGCAPLEVEFSAPLSSENKYYWDFKNGASSEKQNPVNVFGKPGTYNVTFQQGTTGPVLKTITIKVYPRPVPKVSFDPIGCTPYDATLKNTSVIDPSIQINKFKWVFAEGPGSNNSEIVHNFNLLGKHTFAFGLETEFPSCNIDTSYRDAIEVVSPPSAFISTNPGSTISCEEPFNVTFSPVASGTKTLTYTWDMGNSKTSDLKNPPQQSYPKGQYNVLLTISYKEVPSCKVTAARTVSVGKPKASIIATRDSICPATYFPFKTDSPGRIEWKIGSLVSNKAADSVVLFDKGYNSIRLIVRSFDGRCADTAFSRVFVDDIEANIEPLIGFTCESPAKYTFTAKVNQDNVKYHWTFSGDTATSDKKTVEHTYVSKTDSLYYGRNGYERIAANLRVISQITGCESIVSTSDTMWLPNARILPNLTKGCAPLTIKMEDSCRSVDKIVEYKWLYGDNNTEVSDKQKTVTHTYTKPGEYDARIVVKTARGCIDTSYAVRIEVGEDMSSLVDFKASKNEVCPGEQVKLEVTKTSDKIDGYHFYAEDQRLFHCQDEKSATWSFNHSTGMQDVLLTVDYNGCFTTIPKYDLINVKGAIAKIDFQAQCSDPLNYTFTSKSLNADKVTWTLPDMTSNAEVEKYTFKNQGKFNIRLTAETAGCPASTATALINAVRPVAKIKIDTLLCFGQEYKFSAYKSENVFSNCHTGYTWQFPDLKKRPHTSSDSTSKFTFNDQGIHTVRLIIKDINGCRDTTESKFKVFKITPQIATSDSNICIPATVDFDSKGSQHDTTLAAWKWTIADSSILKQNTSFLFTKAPKGSQAIYPVTLEIKDLIGCTYSQTFNLSYYKPVSTIDASDFTLCLGDTVTLKASQYLNGGHKLKFKWDFDNGQTSVNQSEKILYTDARTRKVKLWFEEEVSGCKDTTSQPVYIQEYPVAEFESSLDTENGCATPAYIGNFRDLSTFTSEIVQWKWNFDNGQAPVTRMEKKEETTFYDKRGYIHPTLTVSTSFGCSDSFTKPYRIYKPEGSFEMSRELICKGESIEFKINPDTIDVNSFSWYFGDGDTVRNVGVVLHPYNFHPPSGQTIATLLLENKTCNVSIPRTVRLHKVIADFSRLDGIDSTICFNDGAYQFTNTSHEYTSFAWDFGDGSASQEMNPLHKFQQPGIYDVRLSILNNLSNCVDTIIRQAVVNKNPLLTLKGDTVCLGKNLEPAVLNPVSSNQYVWAANGQVIASDTTQISYNTASTTIFSVTETDTNSCTDTREITGYIIEPVKGRDLDTTIVIGDKVELPVIYEDLYRFAWTPEEGLSCLQCTKPMIQPLKDILYNLTVTDSLNCFVTPLNFNIKVLPETFVKLPSTFTPNGDGVNDRIFVKGWGIKELLEFQVFNRWGQMIYQSQDISEGWDGTFDGVIQNSDVYVYKVKVKTWKDDEIKTEEGYINLVH